MTYLRSVQLLRERAGDPDVYPWSLPVVRGLEELELDPRVTFLVGENGSGKSTLMEALAQALDLNPEGGTQNMVFSTRDTHSSLHDALRVVRTGKRARTKFFLRAESFYAMASKLDDLEEERRGLLDSYGGRSLHEQSHGESFMAAVLHRFTPDGLYLLDEPEAALSPQNQLALIRAMHELAEGGAQFVVATHSPILLGFPGAAIHQIVDGRIERVAYEDTEHYRLTRAFLESPEGFLRHLLG